MSAVPLSLVCYSSSDSDSDSDSDVPLPKRPAQPSDVAAPPGKRSRLALSLPPPAATKSSKTPEEAEEEEEEIDDQEAARRRRLQASLSRMKGESEMEDGLGLGDPGSASTGGVSQLFSMLPKPKAEAARPVPAALRLARGHAAARSAPPATASAPIARESVAPIAAVSDEESDQLPDSPAGEEFSFFSLDEPVSGTKRRVPGPEPSITSSVMDSPPAVDQASSLPPEEVEEVPETEDPAESEDLVPPSFLDGCGTNPHALAFAAGQLAQAEAELGVDPTTGQPVVLSDAQRAYSMAVYYNYYIDQAMSAVATAATSLDVPAGAPPGMGSRADTSANATASATPIISIRAAEQIDIRAYQVPDEKNGPDFVFKQSSAYISQAARRKNQLSQVEQFSFSNQRDINERIQRARGNNFSGPR
ncbi:hypothetical protein H696_01060 [Fonticula alba]|uniref:Uncharacterized protein n=1 Tax=Fonticula alba TaxID=691883 RepID=A0A058ZCI4_FONAL|nr:hypothetical protein H696_01060 [Fonticula alba]KCV71643.1 hypothetical protein H696_01060 [Fonticula alba]|eukprot:XP_009493221.1 hypothetical protein H696_01060 [Fonticula alba]